MVLFRFPFDTKIYTAADTDSSAVLSFMPFEEGPPLTFGGPAQEVFEKHLPQISADELHDANAALPESKTDYLNTIANVIDFVKKHKLPKLVVSRRKKVDYELIDLCTTFLNLCSAYPNAFVYIFVKDGICWTGAFSEVLGKFHRKSGVFTTMSLAGTLPVDASWGIKEIEEQKPVTNFISTVLKKYSDTVQQSGTYDHNSGNIKHLRTDFEAKIRSEQVGALISELHPTPAVCGIPTDLCRSAIKKFEKKPRNFYSGYIKADMPDAVQYFVNLRCAQLFRNGAEIYVGGGITAKSSPEKEWLETDLKAEAIIKNLAMS